MKVAQVWALLGTLLVSSVGLGAATIETITYPEYADGSSNGTPFCVSVAITDWTPNAQVNVRVTTTSGTNFLVWNGLEWASAYSYKNCPLVELNESGNWLGWIFLKAQSKPDERSQSREFKASARKSDASTTISEETTHTIYCMDMEAENAQLVRGKIPDQYQGMIVLAMDESDRILSSYRSEDNSISEDMNDYPESPESGFYQLAIPSGVKMSKIIVLDETKTAVHEISMTNSAIDEKMMTSLWAAIRRVR